MGFFKRLLNIDEFDWIDEHPDNGGLTFYGKEDSESGKTTWYDEDGNLDCITDTPNEYEEDYDYCRRL